MSIVTILLEVVMTPTSIVEYLLVVTYRYSTEEMNLLSSQSVTRPF